ncbi:hypothetical protein CYY_002947 [Polysphondylium violaceum]|uniref:Bacterial surface antigen (D15) domain-containing protein n=1 Tax=Polysphondylium violaceum TaxID=133409 RepID=A0A8J4V0J1_9MYCE|nr:hypothetical protein CYY_002947 [Polysphondylium violaceum]
MVRIVFDKEKPLNSSDEYLLSQYFSQLDQFKDASVSNKKVQDYISRGMDKMQQEGIFYDAELSVDTNTNTITVKPTSRMNFRIGATTDLKQEFCYNTANPFGKGGTFEFNVEMDLKSVIGKLQYSDKTGNTIMGTRTTEKSSYKIKEGFNIDTSSLSWLWKKNRHSFVIKTSDRSVGVDPSNHRKDHLASTGSSYLLSLQHDFSFKKVFGAYQHFGQINSELALPYLSTFSFLKSRINFHQLLDLPFRMKLFFSHSMGGIYKIGNNNTLTPVPDRFFNGHSFVLEGFRDNSLVGSRGGSPYMGSDLFYTSRISLLKSIRDEAYVLGFYSFGNATMDYNSCTSGCGISKSAFEDLFNPKSIRSSIGAGIVFPTNMGLLQFYFVKPLTHFKKDKLNAFGFHATFSM